MYCRQCGTFMPEDSRFCGNCGTKLFVDVTETTVKECNPIASPQLDVQGRKPSTQSILRRIYYQRLAEVLAEEGFLMDPRFLRKEDAVKSVEPVLKVGATLASVAVSAVAPASLPLGGVCYPLLSTLVKATALSGDDLYRALAHIMPFFSITAVKYKLGDLRLFVATEADGLEGTKTEKRADMLCEALCTLLPKYKKTKVSATCLYVFFDAQRCLQVTPHILSTCHKRKMSIWSADAVDVLPIVADATSKKIYYNNKGALIGQGAVPKEVLLRAFVWNRSHDIMNKQAA